MKTIGILTHHYDPTGADVYSVVNPDHPYMVMTPEECPDDLLPVIMAVAKEGKFTPLGVVVDPEVDLDNE